MIYNFAIAPSPTINQGPETVVDSNAFTFRVGNDFCLRLPADPQMFGIECTQDPDLTIPASPAPVATWSLNGMRLVDTNANFELSDDTTFGGLGENGRLSTLIQLMLHLNPCILVSTCAT